MTSFPTDADHDFTRRHIGPSDAAIEAMLKAVGFASLDDLSRSVIPAEIAWLDALDVPTASSEQQVLAELATLADANDQRTSMIGLGYCGTVTPGVLLRNILENPAWYTAYTPYQPEISQGRLEALLNFQTLIEDLTALPIAGSSLLDEPTAAAEAMAMAARQRTGSFLVDVDTHPQTLAVLATRAEPIGITLCPWVPGDPIPDEAGTHIAGALISYPGSSGLLRDPRVAIRMVQERGGLAVLATDLLALTIVSPPGDLGADIAVGSAQRFGVPLGFGGPHAGFLAVRAGLERSLPGRLVGVSVDADGTPAYRLALQTREQHIRRERATSNICTAQVLLAVISAMYASYHGPDGLRAIAERTHRYALSLANGVRDAGARLLGESGNPPLFDTVRWCVPGRARDIVDAALDRGINIRYVDENWVSATTDERTTSADISALIAATCDVTGFQQPTATPRLDTSIPVELRRTSGYLPHPVFHRHQTETAMLRYLRSLADKDIALDRSMIPLGSCTMKLNATTEMIPITWPGFGDIHPFAPEDQTRGYRTLITQLETWLAEITGYAAVSVQPNAGSQGEFAGLLAIRGYLRGKGEGHRDVCLIPSSAHGTNAASAVMAGMRVYVVACDDRGNVDLDDLRRLIDEHAENLAAIMITYPSTHGVYESTVTELCALVHDAGGQVYVDGANLNALVGLAKPGRFGADVSHLNLHKTFCIPHGGGGPGVGPVAVRQHLAPYLPSHPMRPDAGPVGRSDRDGGVGPVSGAPWGSAGILPIPWAYIRLMGPAGLRRATQVAVLAANYLATRLRDAYPILYSGEQGLVAHECILDLRGITAATGVTVDDVAKRLMDYGFHAPTMSFPVPGTLMVEPTESEDLAELDRFVEAMIAIRAEIDQVAAGHWPVDDNPLSNAPHTAQSVIGEWHHPYPARLAAYPVPGLLQTKVWPAVRRIDGAFGDRNLVCSCPRPEELHAAR